MSIFPRIAVGTVQPAVDCQPLLWALLDVLKRKGRQVQVFFSQARFPGYDGARPITGRCMRYLDSWVMTQRTCRELFCHGAAGSDLAIVHGTFGCGSHWQSTAGGSLDSLCQWLDLPRVVVIDVSRLDHCTLTCRPPLVDAVLLDRVRNVADAARWQTTFEALWGVPVLGYLDLAATRHAQLLTSLPGKLPTRQLCRALGNRLAANLQCGRLLELAYRRPLRAAEPRLFLPHETEQRLRIAVAYDEAFQYYFPDTLDLLEARGASIEDFSPLHSERLPPKTDVVYLGCGHAERYATALADNACMKASLRQHVRRGGRVYAEGSGLAYLAQQLELPDGRWYPMSGLLPLRARYTPAQQDCRPMELTLVRDNWLGRSLARLRGYLNGNWQIELACWSSRANGQRAWRSLELVGRHQVIGSRLNLDFAAQPQFINSFFRPVPPPVRGLRAS